MDKHPENGWLKFAWLTLMHRLKQFTQLWSLQTLTDLPDRLRNIWQQLKLLGLSIDWSRLMNISTVRQLEKSPLPLQVMMMPPALL